MLTLDECCFCGSLVLHLHELNHVQVNRFPWRADRQHGVHARVCQHLGQAWVHLQNS